MLNNSNRVHINDKLVLDMNCDVVIGKDDYGTSPKFRKKYMNTKWSKHHGKTVVVLARRASIWQEEAWNEFVVRFESDSKDTYFITFACYLSYPKKKAW